jgi:integrase
MKRFTKLKLELFEEAKTMAKGSNHVDGVYKRKDRSGYWINWIDAHGRRRWRKTNAPNLTQARAARGAELARVEQAKTIGFVPPGEDTFEEIAARFLAYQKARLTSKAYQREDSIVELHLKPFFACKVASIRKVNVQKYITARCNSVAPATVLREVSVLKHILSLAVEWEIIPVNPSQGVKAPKPPAGRLRYLQPTELRALIDACPDWLRPIVGLAVSTGMRRSEILGLRWLDLDLEHGRLMLPQTKNGEGRIVYLNQIAVASIESLPSSENWRTTDRLFPDIGPDQISVAFGRVCKKVGIEDFSFHDLRHTAASWMRMKGADIHTVAQLLGHKDLRMAARYQHLSPQFLSEAVRTLDGVFGDLRYQGVTAVAALPEGNPVSAAESVASPTGFEPVLPH